MEKIAATVSSNDALVLQRLSEVGEEDIATIAHELHEPRARITKQLLLMKKRGLVRTDVTYGELLVSLTAKGRRTIKYFWPDAQLCA